MTLQFQQNGQAIIMEHGEEIHEALDLKCSKCGHKLSEHFFKVWWHYPDPHHHTVYTAGGMKDVACEKFYREDK